MEGNYLTAGELALIEQRGRGYNYGHDGYCDYGHRKMSSGAATGIGLAAGLGGGALLLAIAGIWGVNQASKARAKGAENAVNLVNSNIAQLTNLQIAETQNRQNAIAEERVSRETWQNYHAPTTTQYVDVQTGAGAFSGATSNALATALALQNNNGLNSAIGGCNFLRVARYSAPQPCGCDSCND